MGIFDGAKAALADSKAKATARGEARGDQLGFVTAQYIGGYEDHEARVFGSLMIFENQLEYKVVPGKHSFQIPMSEVADIAIEGKDEASSRVTMTRMLALGIFAFAAKKKTVTKESFITLVLADGQEILFHVEGKSPGELKGQMAGAISAVRKNAKA